MKLSHLYTNDNSVFWPIKFREGLNAIIARIQHPTDDDKSSHCLGKTLIIDVIDFCLLKTVGRRGHFLKMREDLFGGLIFFLEIQIGQGEFVTVRRDVCKATRISFKRHQQGHLDLSNMPEHKWDHANVSLSRSLQMLNGYLDLKAIKPWSYRKGFNYFLRRQKDYQYVFQLQKFIRGHHKDWKPYVARVLGFNEKPIIEKYKADAKEAEIRNEQARAQGEVTVNVSDYERLQASILAKSDDISEKVAALDRFDFNEQEIGLINELADNVEVQIAELNDRIYNVKFDLAQVQRGLEAKVHFNIKEVQRIFEEAELTFPDQLVRDYSELVNFNRRIQEDRQVGLEKRCKELEATLISLKSKVSELSAKRMEILKILGETDSLKKFKKLQRELDRDRATLELMREKAAKLEHIKAFEERLQEVNDRKDELVVQIRDLLKSGSNSILYQGIQRTFNRIIKEVLHRTAVLYVKQNASGNIEFNAEYTDSHSEEETQEGRGTSFRKILCIAFDLAVLINYSKDQFFHFVYHDGALEQLESKRKLSLLHVVRRACREHGIQYIFSANEEELPIDDYLDKLCPHPGEIVLELHDGGRDGRLFKVKTF